MATIAEIIKGLNVKVGSEYFGTKIHGGGNCLRCEYVRHDVSIWVEFSGHHIEYQTGHSFFGGDFNCPSEHLEAYECSHQGLDDVLRDNYYEDDGLIDVCGHMLDESQAKELLEALEGEASEKFNSLTDDYSDDPDDYYMSTFDGTYHQKEAEGHYCIANECGAHSGQWVEGTLYRIIDTRDGETEEVVAESEDDAARRAGVMINNWYEEYIDRDYRVEVA